ncbi:trigger factor [candidate division KSB1 bacterium]|nr:trigger factor [candidate division KSB1 bacterium]
MRYDISNENCHTTISVLVPVENIKQELEENFDEYQKTASVGGFRPGKVPRSLIKKMFGKQIENAVYAPYIKKAWQNISKENEFDLLTEPKILDVKLEEKNELSFKIEFDVRPEIQINDYNNLPVEKVIYEIGEEDIATAVENIRQRNAMIYTVENEAQDGHYIVADLQELDRTGVPVIGQKIEGQVIYLNKENKEIFEQLKAVKVGDTRRVLLKKQQEKNGLEEKQKPEEKLYNVHIKEIKERKVPDLDDAFAQDVGFDSLEDLKNRVKDDLEIRARDLTQSRFELALEDELIKRTEFDAPSFYVNNYLNAIIQDAKKEKKGKVDETQLLEYYRPIAIRNVRWILVREKLIEQFGLDVTDEEVDTYIASLEAQGAKKEQIKNLKNARGRKKLKNEIQDRKIHEFLAKHADISKVKKSYIKRDDEMSMK